MKKEELDKLFDQAIAFKDNDESDKAIEIYRKILAEKEDWHAVNYNLGLIYKYKLDWEKSFKYNARAVEIKPEEEASQWNLGIAATMLKKWKIARKCWNYFGSEYEDSDEDPAGDRGMSPIRINPDGEAEVIWARRIDPARAIIKSIPFPESEHRFGDLILNDGASFGTRTYDGKEYHVLNELQILEESKYQTFSIECDFQDSKNYELLESACLEKDIEIENWTTDVDLLCKQCSEGTPHEHHKEETVYKDKKMTIAFASKSGDVLSDILNEWSVETGLDFDEFYVY